MRELLIVGVDPGTTVGYAVLDTAGKVLKTRSSKQLELNSLLEELVKLGSVLAIGTDKKNCPGLVEKAAAATGAKTITPKEDITVSEKDALTRGIETSTGHEKDALAAAIYAYRELEPLLQRIRKALEAESKLHIYREVTETVVTEGINIKQAIREVEEIAQAQNLQNNEIATATAAPKESMLLKRLERENKILRDYASKLLGRIRRTEKERARIAKDSRHDSRAALQRKSEEKEKNRSELLTKLQGMLNEKDRQIGKLKAEMRQLETIMAAGSQIVKKLNTLGFEELQQKNSILEISENDVVLVENPGSFSEKTLEYLRQRNATILTGGKMTAAVARIFHDAELTAIPAEGIIMAEAGNFAAANRERLAGAMKKRNSNVFGLIENYKEERRIQLQ